MKKTLLASICAVAMYAASNGDSCAQGTVYFANWVSSDQVYAAPVSYASTLVPAGKENQVVGSQFSAQLLYSFGGSEFTLASGSTTAFTGVDGDEAGFAGFFFGSEVTIPGYTAGPISFIVQAFNGADYASSLIRGQSAEFTLPAIATGQSPVGDLFNSGNGGLQGFTVAIVPEPSIFALAGLGSAALLAFRKRN